MRNIKGIDALFAGVDSFYSPRNLRKFLFSLEPRMRKDKKHRALVKRISVEASRAYAIGVSEGLDGKEKPTIDGLDELSNQAKDVELTKSILKFHHVACLSGWLTGTLRKMFGG